MKDWRTIIMKKRLFALLLAAMICMTMVACGDDNTENVDELASSMQNSGAVGIITPSESVMGAMAKKWIVVGSEDVYEMEADGKGTKNGEDFTFECGFNEDNKITMHITLGDTEEIYLVSTDTTGYGVNLKAVEGAEDKVFLPVDLEFLSLDDDRAAGIAATWEDASGNLYMLGEDFSLVIDGVKNDSEGTYSVVEDTEGTLLISLVINGSSFEYEYSFNDARNELTLKGPDSDFVAVWNK